MTCVLRRFRTYDMIYLFIWSKLYIGLFSFVVGLCYYYHLVFVTLFSLLFPLFPRCVACKLKEL
jgi:hypothetical protein